MGRRIKVAIYTILVLMGLGGAFRIGQGTAPGPSMVVDTVTVVEFREREAELEVGDTEGLGAALEAREERAFARELVVDTVVLPPDTVFGRVMVEDGRLSVSRFIVDTISRASILEDADVRDCDEGWSIGPGGLRCDRARLGHLYLLGVLGASTSGIELASPRAYGEIGLEWRPSYRSDWGGGISIATDGRLQISLSRRVRLF